MQKRSIWAVGAAVVVACGAGLVLDGRAQARGDESAAKAPAGAVSYKVDSTHSAVMYRIGHLGVSHHYGQFAAPTGTYTIDWSDPSKSAMEVSVALEKLNSGNEKRDGHLRSPDFFNAEKFASITFKGTSFAKDGDKKMKIKGDLTMLGVTRPVEVSLAWIGEAETKQGSKSGFDAEFTIKRSDFGMKSYLENNAIGDEVKIWVGVEGVKG